MCLLGELTSAKDLLLEYVSAVEISPRERNLGLGSRYALPWMPCSRFICRLFMT